MNIALILSGGVGTRLASATPKQYIEVEGKPVIAYGLSGFAGHPMIDKIQIVAQEQWRDRIEPWAGSKLAGFTKPGENRQLSIWNGICDILEYADETDCVIIHDAARPLISEQMITNCLEELKYHEGVIPVLPMKDTVYLGENGRITSLLKREQVVAGQAPEAFVLGRYFQANKALMPDKILAINGSTEPAVLFGMDVVYIPGDEANFKITTEADLERFARIAEGMVKR